MEIIDLQEDVSLKMYKTVPTKEIQNYILNNANN